MGCNVFVSSKHQCKCFEKRPCNRNHFLHYYTIHHINKPYAIALHKYLSLFPKFSSYTHKLVSLTWHCHDIKDIVLLFILN